MSNINCDGCGSNCYGGCKVECAGTCESQESYDAYEKEYKEHKANEERRRLEERVQHEIMAEIRDQERMRQEKCEYSKEKEERSFASILMKHHYDNGYDNHNGPIGRVFDSPVYPGDPEYKEAKRRRENGD